MFARPTLRPTFPPQCAMRSPWRDRTGTVALEFALLLPLFLTLVFMVIELGLLCLTQGALDNATRNAARLIETGQVQQAGNSQALFRSALCRVFSTTLMNCDGLTWQVRSGNSFATLYAAANATGASAPSSFSPGDAGDRVVVQVHYSPSLVLPFLSEFLSGDGTPRLSSTTAFQNEPYE